MRTYGQPRKHRLYELKDYDPLWKKQFAAYAERLRPILGDNLISIEHMGSTSIEGMAAKPQIDMFAVVKDLDKVRDVYPAFEVAGFVPRGREYVGIGDEYVTLDDEHGKRLAGIHIFPEGHWSIEEERLWRRYLSTHKDERDLYSNTKRDLYAKHKENYEGYDTGKNAVIKEIKARACEWAKTNP